MQEGPAEARDELVKWRPILVTTVPEAPIRRHRAAAAGPRVGERPGDARSFELGAGDRMEAVA